MVSLINSTKLIEHHLYAYRPSFLDGSKDAKSAYRLIEEIFNESIKELTATPEFDRVDLVARLGVSEKTLQRATNKLVNEGRISYERTSKGKCRYSLLYQGNIQLPEDCLLLDSSLTTSISLVAPGANAVAEAKECKLNKIGKTL